MRTWTMDRLLLGSLAVLFVGFIVMLGFTLHDPVVKEGDRAPSFEIRTDAGRKITPTSFGGKLLLLNFWATWCAPCVTEIPSLDQLQRRFSDQGLVVVGISVDKDEKAYRSFLQRFPVAFQTARDESQKVNTDYGTLKFPETYLIDGSGKVIKKIVSSENWADDRVVSYVQSLL